MPEVQKSKTGNRLLCSKLREEKEGSSEKRIALPKRHLTGNPAIATVPLLSSLDGAEKEMGDHAGNMIARVLCGKAR